MARTLVLFDADLPSVLAAAYAAEEAAIPSRRPSLSRVIRGAGEAREGENALPPLVMPAFFGLPDAPEREGALARAIDLLGLERVRDDVTDLAPGLSPRTEIAGEDHTRLLVHAAYLAASLGCDRVVWPVHLGEDLRAASPSLERVSAAIDRALLVSRLVGLDLERLSGGIEVQTPLVDLSDRQIAEMVIDIEAPLSACWWWGNQSPSAVTAHDRWGSLLRAMGWGGALAPV